MYCTAAIFQGQKKLSTSNLLLNKLTVVLLTYPYLYSVHCTLLYLLACNTKIRGNKSAEAVQDLIAELTIKASPCVDSNTFTMGNLMPESTLTLCQSRP